MFTLIKQTKIVEIIDNKRVYKNFLHSIEKIAFIFVEVYELQLKKIIDHETKFFLFIEIFRHHMRMKKIRKKKINDIQLDICCERKQKKRSFTFT